MQMLDKHRHIVPVEEAAEEVLVTAGVTAGVTAAAETGADNVDDDPEGHSEIKIKSRVVLI